MMFSVMQVFAGVAFADDNQITLALSYDITAEYVQPGDVITLSMSLEGGSWTKVEYDPSIAALLGELYNSNYGLSALGYALNVDTSVVSFPDVGGIADAIKSSILSGGTGDVGVTVATDAQNMIGTVTNVATTSVMSSFSSAFKVGYAVSSTDNLALEDPAVIGTVLLTVAEGAADGDTIVITVSDNVFGYGGNETVVLPYSLPQTLTVDAAAPAISAGDTALEDGKSYSYDYAPTFTVADTVSGVASVTVDGTEVYNASTGEVSIGDGTNMVVVVTDNVGYTTTVTLSIDSAAASAVATAINALPSVITYENIDSATNDYADALAAYEKLRTNAQAGLATEKDY